MKIKFEIDMEDIIYDLAETWNDDNSSALSLKSSVINSIKQEVLSEIRAATQKQVKDAITTQLMNESNQQVAQRITLYCDEFIAKGILNEGTPHQITVREMVEKHFTNSRLWDNLRPSIVKIGEEFAANIKAKYNLVFASTILTNLKENNLLNNDVVKALFKE